MAEVNRGASGEYLRTGARRARSRSTYTPFGLLARAVWRRTFRRDGGRRELGQDAFEPAHILVHDEIGQDALQLPDVLFKNVQALTIGHERANARPRVKFLRLAGADPIACYGVE
ncbi:MAG TPA: hypothetical protein VH765_12305 [Xanthobacteraceae bacterium]